MTIQLHNKIRHNPFIYTSWTVSLIKLAVIISIITLSSGCAISKYRLAKKDTPPLIEMNLHFNQPPVDVLLHTVIIYKGTGSWKSEALWDEYIVSITNQGALPLTIISATLVDFQDRLNSTGNDPWKLEKQTKTWWKNVSSSGPIGKSVAFRTGVGALAFGSGALFINSTTFWGATTSSSGAVLGAAGLVAVPVVTVFYIVSNVRCHNIIESEFNKRNLVLPVTIQASQAAKGSLFFPITPGPKRLILHYQIGEEEHDAKFDLSPLKGLHMKEKDVKLENPSSQK